MENGKLMVQLEASTRIDKLVAQYVVLRDRKRDIDKRYKEEVDPLDGLMAKVEGLILEIFETTGQESARTKSGTAYIKVNHYTSLSDPDAFMDLVEREKRLDLLDRRANKTACMEYAEKHGFPPAGVAITSERVVNIRRS